MYKQMSTSRAVEIANNFIVVLKKFFNTAKIFYLTPANECLFALSKDEESLWLPKECTIYKCDLDIDPIKIVRNKFILYNPIDPKSSLTNNLYIIKYKGIKYEINFYDSPESCGFNRCIKNIDDSKIVFCYIKQYREDTDDVKFDMSFDFDITTMRFLELYNVSHININGMVREYTENKGNLMLKETSLLDQFTPMAEEILI